MAPLKLLCLSGGLSTAIVAGGCSPLTHLPDGQLSGMNADSNRLRSSIRIEPATSPVEIKYKPTKSCHYSSDSDVIGLGISHETEYISLEAIGDKLYVLDENRETGQKASHIIDRSGHVYDMHVPSRYEGNRSDFTSENKSDQSARILEPVKNEGKVVNPRMIDNFTLDIPEITNVNLNQVSAYIYTLSGAKTAAYLFKGLTTFTGRKAAVFDLQQTFPDAGLVLVGFNVIELATSMPLLAVNSFDGQHYSKIEQLSCES
jgi:hypothetical protein